MIQKIINFFAGTGSDQAAGTGSDQAAGTGSDQAAGTESDQAAGTGSDQAAEKKEIDLSNIGKVVCISENVPGLLILSGLYDVVKITTENYNKIVSFDSIKDASDFILKNGFKYLSPVSFELWKEENEIKEPEIVEEKPKEEETPEVKPDPEKNYVLISNTVPGLLAKSAETGAYYMTKNKKAKKEILSFEGLKNTVEFIVSNRMSALSPLEATDENISKNLN